MRSRSFSLYLALTAVLVPAFSAEAIPIGAGAFGGGAAVESFEGLAPGPNIPLYGSTGFLEPGVVGPFGFASGATLTSPIPNPGFVGGVLIGDWSIGSAGFGLAGNGFIGSAADVPFGSAYLALNDYAASGPIEFTFSTDMLRVGGYVTGAFGDITMSTFDSSAVLLETVSIGSVDVSSWGSNFIGLENVAGIRSVTFSRGLRSARRSDLRSRFRPRPRAGRHAPLRPRPHHRRLARAAKKSERGIATAHQLTLESMPWPFRRGIVPSGPC